MKVVVCPADHSGCGFYRLRAPARVLASHGADVEVRDGSSGVNLVWDRPWAHLPAPPPDARVVGLDSFDGDVLVIQRPGRRWWADAIPHLQAAGVAVVVDVDDLLDRVHPANPAAPTLDPRRNTWHNHRWVDLACELADLVTVTTPALARRYGHGHGVVLPNLIPQAYLHVDPVKRPGSVGWAGSVATHPGDLEVTGGAVGQVLGATPFHVIGTGDGVRVRLGLHADPTSTGWVPLTDYPARVAELEMGIVPLAPTPFNEAKSCLKLAEMAALGVAVVASPTPDNRRLHARGVGLLAESRGQWARRLRSLLASPDLRAEVAGRSREAMAGLTYEAHAGRWLDAWQGAKIGARAA